MINNAARNRSYYVYVYVDPRNLEEFYYGKGKGSRKLAHLIEKNDSEKVKRIRAIAREGQKPIIKTVAAGLTEDEAHLIETTLIWKLGRTLTNRAAGRFVGLFRPHNSFHKELPGLDFQNRIYYVNVGEGPHRNWDDCLKFGFLSAGQGAKWKDQLLDIVQGDVLVAYLARHGFVGVGKVLRPACRYSEFHRKGRLLHEFGLRAPKMWENSENPEKSEYVIEVSWVKAVSRDRAKWRKRSGLFTTQLVRASLAGQPQTLQFVEKEFGVDLAALLA